MIDYHRGLILDLVSKILKHPLRMCGLFGKTVRSSPTIIRLTPTIKSLGPVPGKS